MNPHDIRTLLEKLAAGDLDIDDAVDQLTKLNGIDDMGFAQMDTDRKHRTGMEGALPSVVAGLISRPIVAVPTSVGYGASFGGIAALLGMLNACSGGIGVVNIDNGFGAATVAHRIARRDPEGETP